MSSRKSGKTSARDARYQKRRASMAIASLRKGPENKETPIAIFSSDDDNDAEGDGLTAGALQLSTERKSNACEEKSDRNQHGEDPLAAAPKSDFEDDGTDADGTTASSKVATDVKDRNQAPQLPREADSPGVRSSETSICDKHPVESDPLEGDPVLERGGLGGSGVEDALSSAGDGGHSRDSGPRECADGEKGEGGNDAGDTPSGGDERDHGRDSGRGFHRRGSDGAGDDNGDGGDENGNEGDRSSCSDDDEEEDKSSTLKPEDEMEPEAEKKDGKEGEVKAEMETEAEKKDGKEGEVEAEVETNIESHKAGSLESDQAAGAEADSPPVPVSGAHSDGPLAIAENSAAFPMFEERLEPEAADTQVDAMEVDDDADSIPQCSRQEFPAREPSFQDISGRAVSPWTAEAEGDTVEEVDSEGEAELRDQGDAGQNGGVAEGVEAANFRSIQGEDGAEGHTRAEAGFETVSEAVAESLTRRKPEADHSETTECGTSMDISGTQNEVCGRGAASGGVEDPEVEVEVEPTDEAELAGTAEARTADASPEGRTEEEQGLEYSADIADYNDEEIFEYSDGEREGLGAEADEEGRRNEAGGAWKEGQEDKGYGEGTEEELYEEGGRLGEADEEDRRNEAGGAWEEGQKDKGYGEGTEEQYDEEGERLSDEADEKDRWNEAGGAWEEGQKDKGYGEGAEEKHYEGEGVEKEADEEYERNEADKEWEEREEQHDEEKGIGEGDEDRKNEVGEAWEEGQEEKGYGEGMKEDQYDEEGEGIDDEAGGVLEDEGYGEGRMEEQYDEEGEEVDDETDEEDRKNGASGAYEEGQKGEGYESAEEHEFEEEFEGEEMDEANRKDEAGGAWEDGGDGEGEDDRDQKEEQYEEEDREEGTWEEQNEEEDEWEEESEDKDIGDAVIGDTEDAAINLAESDEEVTKDSSVLDEDERVDCNSSIPYEADSAATPADDGPAKAFLEDVANGTAGERAKVDHMERPEAVDDLEDSKNGTGTILTADGATPAAIDDGPTLGASAVGDAPADCATNADTIAPVGANANPHQSSPRARPMESRACRRVSFIGVQPISQPLRSIMHSNGDDSTESTVKVHARDGMVEFEALLKGFSADDEREVSEFLADPTVRPVDPSLPVLTAEQEKRLSTATSSPSDWDADLILKLNPFLEQARQLLRHRVSRRYKTRLASNPDWPSIGHVVPTMKRRDLSPNASFRPARPHATGKGLAGSAFSIASPRTDGIIGAKRPAFDEHTVRSDNEVVSKRPRLDARDDWSRSTRPPVPGFAAPIASPAPLHRAASISQPEGDTPSVGQPVRGSPRIDSRRNSFGGRLPSWQNSVSKPVNRYRPLDFTPRRRPRSSFSGSNRRDDSLQEWLNGPVGDADAAVGGADGASGGGDRRGVASGGSGNDLGVERPQGLGCSAAEQYKNCASARRDATMAAPSDSNRPEASFPGLLGVASSSALKRTVEEAEKRAARVSAETKASAEVGSILLSMVSQGGGDRQVQEEPGTRAVGQRSEGQGELAQNQSLVLQQQDGTTLTRDTLSSAEDDGERAEEFGFPVRSTHRVPTASPTSASRSRRFSFTRCIPAKRSRTNGEEGVDSVSDYDTLRSGYDSSGVFEFAGVQSASGRRTRRRVTISSTSSMAPPGLGSRSSDDTAAVVGTTRDLSTSTQAPTVKGFDMSLFKKPGEWKCEACFVRNPRERDVCLSCETPKPVGGSGEDAAGLGASGAAPVPTSTIGGALFARSATSNNHTFTFGGQPTGGGGSSGSGASVSWGSPPVQRGFVFGASAK